MTEPGCARSWRALLLASASLIQAACSTDQAATWDTVRYAVSPAPTPDSRPLPDGFSYLRLTVNGVPTMVALGYVDQDEQGRPVHVWYSSAGEVMRTQSGRLVGLVGTPLEWRQVRLSARTPEWTQVNQAMGFDRMVDAAPDYQWSQQHELTVRPAPASGDSALVRLAPDRLRWFAEHERQGRALPARYAVEPLTGQVVYGEQCLSPALCLTWQTWPPTRP